MIYLDVGHVPCSAVDGESTFKKTNAPNRESPKYEGVHLFFFVRMSGLFFLARQINVSAVTVAHDGIH